MNINNNVYGLLTKREAKNRSVFMDQDTGTHPYNTTQKTLIFLSFWQQVGQPKAEAYHLEAFNFPYTFETMLPIIPDQ